MKEEASEMDTRNVATCSSHVGKKGSNEKRRKVQRRLFCVCTYMIDIQVVQSLK